MPIGKILGGLKAAQALFGKKDKPTQFQVDALANIRRVARDVKKGVITAQDYDGRPVLDPFSLGGSAPLMVKFQFNPTELTREFSVQYNEVVIPGSVQPFIEFIGGKATRLTFELVFFAPMTVEMATGENVADKFTSAGYVANKVRQLQLLTGQNQRFAPPPFITLQFSNKSDGLSNNDMIQAAEQGVTFDQIQRTSARTAVGEPGALGFVGPLASFNSDNSLKVTGVVEKAKIQYLKFDRFMRPLHAKVEITLIQGAPTKRKRQNAVAIKKQDLSKTTGMPAALQCPPFVAVRLSVKTLRDKYGVNTWADLAVKSNSGIKIGDPKFLKTQCIMDRNNARSTSYSESILQTMKQRNPLVGLQKAAVNGTAASLALVPTVTAGPLAFLAMFSGIRRKLDNTGEATEVVVPRQGVFAQAEDINTRKGAPEEIAGDSNFEVKQSNFTVVSSAPGIY